MHPMLRILTTALALAVPSAALAALSPAPTTLEATGSGNEKAAKLQLDGAKQLRRAAGKKTGEERRTALRAAADAYRKVATEHPDSAAVSAEAAFRAGEIMRSLGDADAARSDFELAAKSGKQAPQFGARALNELGHLARRKEQFDEAIAFYQRVNSEFPGQDGEGARALTWVGKLEARLGKDEQARTTWLSLQERFPSQPVLAIRAADLAVLSWIEAGDATQAAKSLADVDARFGGDDNKSQAWWSPEVDTALSKMRCRTKLESAGTATAQDSDEEGEEDEDGKDRR